VLAEKILHKSETAFFDRLFWATIAILRPEMRSRRCTLRSSFWKFCGFWNTECQISEVKESIGNYTSLSCVILKVSRCVCNQFRRRSFAIRWAWKRKILSWPIEYKLSKSMINLTIAYHLVAFTSWSSTENLCRQKNQPKKRCQCLLPVGSAMILISNIDRIRWVNSDTRLAWYTRQFTLVQIEHGEQSNSY
jgi:hypothetical protein